MGHVHHVALWSPVSRQLCLLLFDAEQVAFDIMRAVRIRPKRIRLPDRQVKSQDKLLIRLQVFWLLRLKCSGSLG